MTDKTIEAMAKALAKHDNFADHTPYLPQAKAAYVVAREAVLEEVKAELAKHAVKIEGTPYSCGPHKWVKFIHAMKGPSK